MRPIAMLTSIANIHQGTSAKPVRWTIDIAPRTVAVASVQISVAASDSTDIANSPPKDASAVAQQIGHTGLSFSENLVNNA